MSDKQRFNISKIAGAPYTNGSMGRDPLIVVAHDGWVHFHQGRPNISIMESEARALLGVLQNLYPLDAVSQIGDEQSIETCYCGEPIDESNPDCVDFNLCSDHADEV